MSVLRQSHRKTEPLFYMDRVNSLVSYGDSPEEADDGGGGPGDDAPEEDAEHDDVPQEDWDAPQRVEQHEDLAPEGHGHDVPVPHRRRHRGDELRRGEHVPNDLELGLHDHFTDRFVISLELKWICINNPDHNINYVLLTYN